MAISYDQTVPDGPAGSPQMDDAMNKRPNIVPKGVVRKIGDDQDIKLSREKISKLLEKARKRFDRAANYESDMRQNETDDLKFYNGKQWPEAIMSQRNKEKKPCLTINKLPTLVKQITNDARQNRPQIHISPIGSSSDKEIAKMYYGLIRFIERESRAENAYDDAFDSAVRCGRGYWRIVTEYERDDTFDQTIRIMPIYNRHSVYLDPEAMCPTGSDAKWGFITDMITKDEFKELYPEASMVAFSGGGIGDGKQWVTDRGVRIAEYFEIVTEERTLVSLNTGYTGWKDELSDQVKNMIENGSIEILNERESPCNKVKWYKITAVEVLEAREWAGSYIPIVRVVGDVVNVEGKVEYKSAIREAKGPQQMLNYWSTKLTEVVALAPIAPWIVAEGQIEDYQDRWNNANIKSFSYLPYKPVDNAGNPVPPPQRQPGIPMPEGVIQALQLSNQDILSTTGIRFDASLAERITDESGKAIQEIRRQGDITTFHFIDNFGKSLRHTGEILIDLIPKIYDNTRTLTILREDDEEEQVMLNPAAPSAHQEVDHPVKQGKKIKQFNPNMGRYSVTVTIGPSYATKRIEAADKMLEFMKAFPQHGAVIADLYVKNQDWPGADLLATRLAKTLPPNLLAPEMKGVPPQVQALLASQQQQLKENQKQLMLLNKQLVDRNTEFSIAKQQVDNQGKKVQLDFEAKVLALLQKQEVAQANQINSVGEQVLKLVDMFNRKFNDDRAHEPTSKQVELSANSGQDTSKG